jgi:hypothetical protein
VLGDVFSMRFVPKPHKESVVLCSWKPVSSAGEQQLKGASQRGQEPLDTEAATKQHSEDRD